MAEYNPSETSRVVSKSPWDSVYGLLCLCLLVSLSMPWLHLANNREALDLNGFAYLGNAFVDQLEADTVFENRPIDRKLAQFPFAVEPLDRLFYLLPALVWLLALFGLWWRRRLMLVVAIYVMYLHMAAGWWGFWMSKETLWSTKWPALLGAPLLVLTLNEIRGQFWRAKNPGDGRAQHLLALILFLGLALLYAIGALIMDLWPEAPTFTDHSLPMGLSVLLVAYVVGTTLFWVSKLGRLPNSSRLWLAHGGLFVLAFVPYILGFQKAFVIFFTGRYQYGMVVFCVILSLMMVHTAIGEARQSRLRDDP